MHTHAGPMPAASVSMFICALDMLCLDGLVSLVSSTSSGSYTLSPEGKGLEESCYLRLSVPRSVTICTFGGSGSLYLFPSTAGRSFSDDG